MYSQVARAVFDSATAQAGTAGNPLTFTSFTSNTSYIAYDDAGGILLKDPGKTYLVKVDAMPVGTATGQDVEVGLFENGTAVAGARASGTLAASGDFASLSIGAVCTTRLAPYGEVARLTVVPKADASFNLVQVIVFEAN